MEQPIPPGERVRQVGLAFLDVLRVMNSVHLRRHKTEPQYAIQASRDAKIAVLNERLAHSEKLRRENCYGTCTESGDGGKIDRRRDNRFKRMESKTRREIKLLIGVMCTVDSPQQRYTMKKEMLGIRDQIKHGQGSHHVSPQRQMNAT
jgi:hypothetical protein